VTLRDGPGSFAGRVELNNGTRGSLCGYDLTIHVGHVICKQLGYKRAVATTCCNPFGQGTSSFSLYNVKCNGNESSLADCDFKAGAPALCNPTFGFATVVCENPNITDSKFITGFQINWINHLRYNGTKIPSLGVKLQHFNP